MTTLLYWHKEKIARAIFAFHIVWMALLVVSIILTPIFIWYRPLHWIIISITVISQIFFRGCFLTQVEKSLYGWGEDKTKKEMLNFTTRVVNALGIKAKQNTVNLTVWIFFLLSLMVLSIYTFI